MFRKNTASQFIHFQGVDATTGGIKAGVTWTVRRCIDGTFAAATGTATEDGSTGWYKFAMSQADTNGNNIGFNFTGTGAVPQTVNIVTTAADPTDTVRFGLTALPNAAAEAAGGLYTRGTGAGQIKQTNNGEIDANATRINNVATTSVTTVSAFVGTTAAIAFSSANVKVDVDTIKTNPVVNGGTITFPTTATLASTTNITSATGIDVTKWLGGTIPAVNTTGVPKVDVTLLKGSVAAGTTGYFGISWADIGTQGASVDLTNTTINTGQKVDVNTIKTQTVTCSGGVTIPAATLASTTNITDGTIATVTDLTTTTYAEPGQGAPAATATLAAKINYLYKAWRNKKTQTSTTWSLFADDASTVDQKSTVSDDGTTATRGEIATGP